LKIFNTRASLSEFLKKEKADGKKIGFVPTMGALHQGHISLIDLAHKQSDLVVCSIFVNPTQFNDPKDLDRYPRPIDQDIQLLEKAACDVLFLPEVAEMYTAAETWHLALDGLDELLEGLHRPGHYQGVTQIVKKLFDTVEPDFAFFGQKDYQQFLVIEKMVQKLGLNVRLMMCPIIRETDGLAMSSRNVHLNPEERKNALALYQTLNWMKQQFELLSIQELQEQAQKQLLESPGIVLEYLEICDGENLQALQSKDVAKIVALVAAKVGQTRLIDNMLLKNRGSV
jgi:pantoate--beta-alanine ligase